MEAVIAHFAHRVTPFDELLPELDRGAVQGVWVSGGYRSDWIDEATAGRFERLKLLVVQDLFPSPLCRAGHLRAARRRLCRARRLVCESWRPAAIGRAGRFARRWAYATEGSLLWELSGRPGLYNSQAVLEEIAREILVFFRRHRPHAGDGHRFEGELVGVRIQISVRQLQ